MLKKASCRGRSWDNKTLIVDFYDMIRVKDKVQIDSLDPGHQLSSFLSCPSPFHLFFINIFLFNYKNLNDLIKKENCVFK